MRTVCSLALALALLVSAGCATANKGITVYDPQGKTREVTPEEVDLMSGEHNPYLLQVGDEIDLQFRVKTAHANDIDWNYRIEAGDSMEVRLSPRFREETEYRIDVGDVIGISFLNNWPLNSIRTVRTDGKITLPQIGDVVATGLTPGELQARLNSLYEQTGIIQGDPNITVNVDFVNLDRLESMSRDVTVRPDGAIRLPGFENDVRIAGLTVGEACRALEEEAARVYRNRPRVSIILFPGLNQTLLGMDAVVQVRPDGKIDVPRLGEYQAAGFELADVRAVLTEDAADIIHNPVDVIARLTEMTGGRIYVGGEVADPGVYALSATPTVLQAVIMAQGPINTSRMNSVLVMRRNPDGKPYVFKTNLHQVLTQGSTENDFYLRSFDVVYVPKKLISRANLFVEQYINDLVPFDNSLGITGSYYLNEQKVRTKSRNLNYNLGFTGAPQLGLGF